MLNLSKDRIEQYKKELKKAPYLYNPVKEKSLEEIGVHAQVVDYVLAPGIADFTVWVLQKALKSGVQRLYFLARDGYFIYQAAELMCKELQLPIECKYLSCSRYSLRVPTFYLDMNEALDYICRGGIDVTIAKILSRTGISTENQEEVLKSLDLALGKDEVIPYARLTEIRKHLSENAFFMKCLYKNSREKFPSLEGYLRQEGLLDSINVAIVDSGWVGSMQRTLNKVLSTLGRKESVEGYYWGLYELPKDVNPDTYHCYYFSHKKGLKEKVYFSNCLFETIFSAPHGMTLSYEERNGRYFPIYDSYDSERFVFMKKTEHYLHRYIEEFVEALKGVELKDLTSQFCVIKHLFRIFMGIPTKNEAEVFGKFQFSDDVLEVHKQEVAVLMTEEELKSNHVCNKLLVMLGIKKTYVKESAWYEGSVARACKNQKWHLTQYAMYKYLLYIRKYFS